MALILLGLKPSFIYAQVVDSVACERGNVLFKKYNLISEPLKSIPALEEALTHFKTGACWPRYVNTYNAIAAAYYYQKEYAKASEYAQLATDTASFYLGEASSEYASSIANHAIFIELMGNYKKSIQLQKKSLAIEIAGRNHDHGVAIAQENLGYSYFTIGDFETARDYYDQALLRIYKTGGKIRYEAARLHRQIAACYREDSEYAAAIESYNKSLEVLDQLPDKKNNKQTHWYACRDLAEVYLELDQLDEAFNYIDQALAIQQKFDMLEAYKSYLTKGDIHLAAQQPQLALQFYQQAAKEAAEEYAIYQKHPGLAAPITHQAKVYTQQKQYDKALQHYEQALALITIEDIPHAYPSVELDIFDGQASLLLQRFREQNNPQDLQKAYQYYQQIPDILQAIRRNYISEDPKNSLAERAVPIIEQGIATTVELHRQTGKATYLEQAFTFAESNKAILLFESLREEVAKGFAGIPDSLLNKGEDLRNEIAYLKRRTLEAQQLKIQESPETVQQWKSQVFELDKAYQAWNTQLEEQYPLYYNGKYQTHAFDIAQLRKEVLKANSAIVEFTIGPRQGFVFLLTKEDLQVIELEDSQSLIDKVNTLRQLIISPPSGAAFKQDYEVFVQQAQQLYQQLLAEGLQQLPPAIEHLIIIPDDILSLLPFELLLRQPPQGDRIDFSPQNLDYLFEDFTISYHYSATLMATLQVFEQSEATTGTFIGFAPSFGEVQTSQIRACTENNLYSLQCNREEVLAIQSLLGGEALLAEAARLDAFQEQARHYQIVHLATHACVDEETAALSKIYLTDANLTPFELNNLRFSADLTVLSACNTGSGKVLKGEGVMSLARSFMLAGSQSVLTSLWSVDDCATSDIMVHYYEGLKAGLSKDKALKAAKLTYLNNADRNSRHPSYWAAFVQFGDVEELQLGSYLRWWLFGGILLLFWVARLFWRRRALKKAAPTPKGGGGATTTI
ncbi:MAG: CHAT domain-containing tetratricopeptide repeat protein [Bacteroidota bacterium]